ncbi:MAG TPA: RnfH family protein [Rhodanobacter sp.]|nr:RnfH family protein [Rhodanobacter sp.]
MPEPRIAVEVVHAGEQVLRRSLTLPSGSTALQAVQASGLLALLPVGAFDPQRLGIFAQRVSAQQVLRDGDRVEIYRPLQLDPMDARRRRARRG